MAVSKVKSKSVKSSSKIKSNKSPIIKNSLITKGVVGTTLGATALAGISLLGLKMSKDKKNLQKELDNTKANLSLSDKKNMDSLKKCLFDIDNNEKIYKNTIETLAKKSENDKKTIIELQKQITQYKTKEEETQKILSECKIKEEFYLKLSSPYEHLTDYEIRNAANIINQKIIQLFECPE